MAGITYMVQPKNLEKTNRFKIGHSSSPTIDRIKDYGKGTRVICVMATDKPRETEKKLISEFGKRFNNYAGKEYFKGNESHMKNTFIKYAKNATNTPNYKPHHTNSHHTNTHHTNSHHTNTHHTNYKTHNTSNNYNSKSFYNNNNYQTKNNYSSFIKKH